jgi:hypothetical protein
MGLGVSVNTTVGSRDGLWAGAELFVKINVLVSSCADEPLDGTGVGSIQVLLSEPVGTSTDGRVEGYGVKVVSVVPFTILLLELNETVDTRLGTIDGELRAFVGLCN